MKYYIKATNTETGESMIMPTPIFTSKKKAKEFASNFVKLMNKPIAKMEVVSGK